MKPVDKVVLVAVVFLVVAIALSSACTPVTPTPIVTPTATPYPTYTPTPIPHNPTPTPVYPTCLPSPTPVACLACPPLHPELYGGLAIRTAIGDAPGARVGLTATVLFSYTEPLSAAIGLPQVWSLTTEAGSGFGANAQVLPGVWEYGILDYEQAACYVPFLEPVSEIAVSAGGVSLLDIEFVEKPGCKPTPTPSPTPTPTQQPAAYRLPPGAMLQYDYPCSYPLWNGLCPNGLYSDGTIKNNNAYRTAGGMDWAKLNAATGSDFVGMGGTFWVEWDTINPSDGVYNWYVIDNLIAGAKALTMDAATGKATKGVVIRLYNHASTRPAQRAVAGIDGGFVFDDRTPAYVKERLKGAVSWGGPIVQATGKQVTQDDGSYWVKMPCVFTDYQASKPQGSLWNYSIWVVPKYNRQEWRDAAAKMLRDVGAYYEGHDVTFLLGLNGIDNEYGNYVQNSFAGCGNLRSALGAQYGVSTNDMLWRDMAAIWRSGAPTLPTYVSCTSDCNPAWFAGLNVGLFQARAVDDGPNYHRSGDIGVLDWALKWAQAGRPVAWENAYTSGDDASMYKMLSTIMATWPDWMSFVGGSWANAGMIRRFLPDFGLTIATTPRIDVKMSWTCYGYPSQITCPGVDVGMVSSQYMGWMNNLERGLALDGTLAVVNPWTQLTAAQRSDYRYKMLRLLDGKAGLFVDGAWPHGAGRYVIGVEYIDAKAGTLAVTCVGESGLPVTVAWELFGTGAWESRSIDVRCNMKGALDAAGYNLTIEAAGIPLHRVSVEVIE